MPNNPSTIGPTTILGNTTVTGGNTNIGVNNFSVTSASPANVNGATIAPGGIVSATTIAASSITAGGIGGISMSALGGLALGAGIGISLGSMTLKRQEGSGDPELILPNKSGTLATTDDINAEKVLGIVNPVISAQNIFESFKIEDDDQDWTDWSAVPSDTNILIPSAPNPNKNTLKLIKGNNIILETSPSAKALRISSTNFPRVKTYAASSDAINCTPEIGVYDTYVFDGLGGSLTINPPSTTVATPKQGQVITFSIYGSNTAQNIVWHGNYKNMNVSLPMKTIANSKIIVELVYDAGVWSGFDIQYLDGYFRSLTAYKYNHQIIDNNSSTLVTFDDSVRYNNYRFYESHYNNIYNQQAFYPVIEGYYLINAAVSFGPATSSGYVIMSILQDGSNTILNAQQAVFNYPVSPVTLSGSGVCYLSPVNSVSVYAYQQTGSSMTILGRNRVNDLNPTGLSTKFQATLLNTAKW